MKKMTVLIVVMMGILAAGVAFAQVPDEIVYPKVTILDIDQPMHVPGEIVKPANSYLPVKKGADFETLIPVRDNFLPEIMKTVGGL